MKIIDKFFIWSQLNKIGKLKIFKSAYFWIFIVPILAKVLMHIEETVIINIFNTDIRLSIGLPFSWKLFYFSSVSFSVATLIYSFKCPEFIKEYKNYKSYIESGKSSRQLHGEINKFVTDKKKKESFARQLSEANGVDNEDKIKDIFWKVRDFANISFPCYRYFCSLFFVLGFILISIILIQNFIYVFKATF
ncbi:MAG: hypothetical protein GF353_02245 [Candidatus Lokiarchaeota archaeon]|nr:hypothetical protein [Candidatus Lokiarchaeota archaeon]